MAELRAYRRYEGTDPELLTPEYESTRLRAPLRPLTIIPQTLTELTGPAFGHGKFGPLDHDLTKQHAREPLGERIILHGRILDADARPVPDTLVEIWQANAAGRYVHSADRHPAPLDPNFGGAGRCLTDADGRYEFITIKPGAYPLGSQGNVWRPAHIHLSLFGPALATRLITQMYFPGDPLFFQDPIFNSVRDERARRRMICAFDLERTVPEWALAFRFDVILRGRDETPMER